MPNKYEKKFFQAITPNRRRNRSLRKVKSYNNFSKNDYNRGFRKEQPSDEDVDIQDLVYQPEEQETDEELEVGEENNEIGENHVINNIVTRDLSKDNKEQKIISGNVNNNGINLISNLYNDITNFKSRMAYFEQVYQDECGKIKTDEKYNEALKKSDDEKSKVNMMKPYIDFKNVLAEPMLRLLQNMDDNGKISGGDFEAAFNDKGPMGLLKKRFIDDIESKDDKGKYRAPGPLRTFLKKALENYENIVNNCGFSFNPSKMRNNLGIIAKDVADVYENASIFSLIITAIYNFFTFSNFFQDMTEVKNIIKSLYRDVDLYYKAPFEERQNIVDSMNGKISRIKYLFSNTFLLKKDTLKAVQTIESYLDDAMSIKVGANDIVVAFIKAFGQNAVSGINMSLISKGAYNSVLSELTSAIEDKTGLSKDNSRIVAKGILDKEKKEDIKKAVTMTDEQEKLANMFFDGMLQDEYEAIKDELQQVGSFEDAKININKNLQKVDAITNTTDAIVKATSLYISRCRSEINALRRKYRVSSSAVDINANDINQEINSLSRQMLESIQRLVENSYKGSFYEYENDFNKRQEAIKAVGEDLKKTKENIIKAIENRIYKDGKPKPGKEAEAADLDNNIKNMKNIAELCFNSWEIIQKMVDDFKKEIERDNFKSFAKSNKKSGNLFNFFNKKASIENKVMNKMLNNGYISPYHGRRRKYRQPRFP